MKSLEAFFNFLLSIFESGEVNEHVIFTIVA